MTSRVARKGFVSTHTKVSALLKDDLFLRKSSGGRVNHGGDGADSLHDEWDDDRDN